MKQRWQRLKDKVYEVWANNVMSQPRGSYDWARWIDERLLRWCSKGKK